MSDSPMYSLDLLRAELKAAMAELTVQLVDRFASKQDLERFRLDFAQHQREDEKHFRDINDKLDLLLTEKDQRDGATAERRGLLESRRLSWTLIVMLVCALISLIAAHFIR